MVTGPGILVRRRYQTCAHRVEVDVSKQGEQILIGIHQQRVIKLLEKMPGRLQSRLHAAGVAASQQQHDLAEGCVAYLEQRVDVVSHIAVRVQLRAAVDQDVPDDVREQIAIVRGEENILTMIAAQRYVIQRSRRV